MADHPESIAFDGGAPAPERLDAQTELQKAHMPSALSDLIPNENVRQLIQYAQGQMAEQEMLAKSARKVLPFPSDRARKPSSGGGMQSVFLDDFQINAMGEWWEKPGPLSFDGMRAMVDQTPILSAIVMTRLRQISRFCNPLEKDDGPGFQIRHKDLEHKVTAGEKEEIKNLTQFVVNCGWEQNPRKRRAMRRTNFSSFMMKWMRDSLTMDSAPIETEFRRNINMGIDGFYAVDGATIRLVNDVDRNTGELYEGPDAIFALQVIQGRIRTEYTLDDLVYEARNPRTNVELAGYGMSECEVLIRTVTAFLNAMTLNMKGFTDNAIPRGILQLIGDYKTEDLQAFKVYWQAMCRGVQNSWAMPILTSKTKEGTSEWLSTKTEFNEMYFSKWMTFLTSMACAVYTIHPSEINFDGFTDAKSSLSGDDSTEKLAHSTDKGLRPLMAYAEGTLSDYVLSSFGDNYVFRWSGLDEVNEDQKHEIRKLVLSLDEMRAEEGRGPYPVEGMGDTPINPALQAAYTALQQQQQQDFGTPDADAEPGAEGGGGPDDGFGGAPGGDPEGNGSGEDVDSAEPPPDGGQGAGAAPLAKSLPYRIDWR